jgi:hypothetical protein
VDDQREDQSQESQQDQPAGREVTFRPDYTAAFPSYYTNFSFVNHTAYDMSMDFCLIAPPYQIDESQGVVRIPVVTRVTIPIRLVEGLINALNSQLSVQRQEQEQKKLGISGPFREDDSDG